MKFKDAELIGVPTIVVVGRGPGRRHRRGQGPRAPASAPTSRSPTSSTPSSPRSAGPGREPGPPARRGGHLRLGRHADALARGRPARAVAGLRPRGARPARRRPRACPPTTSPRPTRSRCASTRPRSAAWSAGRDDARRAPRSPTSSREAGVDAGTTGTTWRSRHTGGSGSRTPSPTRRCGRCGRGCAQRGIRVGVLSNTIWTPRLPPEVFERDGVLDLLDGDVYSSEIDVRKPHPEAFRAACDARRRRRRERARLRRRPALRGRPRPAAGRHARHLVPHSDIPAGPAGRGRRRRPTPWRTSCSTCSTSSTRWLAAASTGDAA